LAEKKGRRRHVINCVKEVGDIQGKKLWTKISRNNTRQLEPSVQGVKTGPWVAKTRSKGARTSPFNSACSGLLRLALAARVSRG
jgi:hypothetical protein